jgi:hypothetical protein
MFIFWVFPRRLSVNSRRFGTLYRFHLQPGNHCCKNSRKRDGHRIQHSDPTHTRLVYLHPPNHPQPATHLPIGSATDLVRYKLPHTSQTQSYFIDLPLKMEPIQCSETSAVSTQTPGKHPKENIVQHIS